MKQFSILWMLIFSLPNLAQSPSVVIRPPAVFSAAGENITLAAQASGSGEFTYQWRYNNVDILGATAATHLLTNAQAEQSGTYSVLASSNAGSATAEVIVVVWKVASTPPKLEMTWRGTLLSLRLLNGETYARYSLETSVDLIRWDLSHYLVSPSNVVDIATFGPNQPREFYRVVSP